MNNTLPVNKHDEVTYNVNINVAYIYMAFIKFGIGRTTSDAAHEIRDGHITRDEGKSLVKRYDGEFPAKHFNDFLDYIEVVFYNLYYCLKQIDTNLDNKSVEFMNNSKFVSNLSFLDNLKKNLHSYILNKRSNENIEKQEHVIKNLIKYQDI